jgi:hypothetical protein
MGITQLDVAKIDTVMTQPFRVLSLAFLVLSLYIRAIIVPINSRGMQPHSYHFVQQIHSSSNYFPTSQNTPSFIFGYKIPSGRLYCQVLYERSDETR